jgi:hypothetical protein
MQPYVIKQGDYLALLAYKFGFDADAIWNDPANKPLQDTGRTPEMLCPADILYIPDPVDNDAHPVAVGQTNAFQSDPPKVTVSIQFKDPSLASQSFTVPELPELATQTVGADGTVSLEVPVTLAAVTFTFSESGDTLVCGIGYLDPVRTFTGVVQRLQNLGFLTPEREYQLDGIEEVRARLRDLRASQSGTGAADPPSSAQESAASPGDDPPTGASAASAGPAAAPACTTPSDNGGMDDSGSIDDATAQLLSAAHGS